MSAYLDADSVDIDPEIAADMLRMAQSSFWQYIILLVRYLLVTINNFNIDHKKSFVFVYSYSSFRILFPEYPL